MKVAIVGGGISGLTAAVTLLRRGHEPVVFEAAERAGGKVGSVRDGGWLTEDGPNFLARPMALPTSVEKIEAQPPKTRFVHLRGGIFRAPSLGLLRQLGISRALLEPLFASRSPESLQEFLVARFGEKAGTIGARLLAHGVYAGDPSKLSAREAFPSLAGGSLLLRKREKRMPIWSLREGLGSLPQALAQELGPRLQLRQPVQNLDSLAAFEKVILALPAPQAAKLFTGELAETLRSFPIASVTVVHLGFPASEAPRGFGVVDATGELQSLGALLPSSMLPARAPEGSALVTVICRGDASLDAALQGVRELIPTLKSAPSYSRIVKWAEGIPQYEIGHSDRVKRARALLPANVLLAGASYDGVSVPEAAKSGELAAEALLK